ncbi:uncharacterized protein [Watersipora subatra]|uniref:uncharacterized protein isoform X2 n=1 Tax=Watersipora subatra TaxID=2589382 RepID=UPI00355BE21D
MAFDSLSQDHRGLPSLLNSLNRALECVICLEDNKDLRALTCCEKLVCLSCLEKAEKCEAADCMRLFDKRCKKCKKCLCYRCSLELCSFDDADHEAMDIRDCITQSREEMHIWKAAREKAIQNSEHQVEAESDLIRNYGQQVAATANESLADVAEEIIPLMTAACKNLVELKHALEMEKSELNFVIEAESKSSDIDLIVLMDQLKIYEDKREIVIGEGENLLNGIKCYDVSVDSSGKILIAKVGGLDIMDAEGKHLLKSLKFEHYVFTVATYKEIIICGVWPPSEKRYMVTLSKEYKELRRWEIPNSTLDFTAVDGKIFLSVGGALHSDIRAYSLDGERLSNCDVPWNGYVYGIDSILPCSIVFLDLKGHKVYKQCVTSGKRQTDWSADVRAPRCLHVDSTGLIWIRSNLNDCLTILNHDGSRHQEDIMETKLGPVNDLLVHNGYLYAAYLKGLVRFPIKYN